MKFIEKLNKIFKKYRLKIYLLLYLLLAFIVPFIINYLYSIKAPIEIFKSKMDASGTLNYIGSVLTGFGTLFLGFVTYNVTRRENIKNTYRPFFVIKDIEDSEFEQKNYKLLIKNNCKYTYITLKNIGNGTAINFYIEDKKNNNRLIDTYDFEYNKRTNNYIDIGKEYKFKIDIENVDKEYEITYCNAQGCIYHQYIKYWCKNEYAFIYLDVKQESFGILGIDY